MAWPDELQYSEPVDSNKTVTVPRDAELARLKAENERLRITLVGSKASIEMWLKQITEALR